MKKKKQTNTKTETFSVMIDFLNFIIEVIDKIFPSSCKSFTPQLIIISFKQKNKKTKQQKTNPTSNNNIILSCIQGNSYTNMNF